MESYTSLSNINKVNPVIDIQSLNLLNLEDNNDEKIGSLVNSTSFNKSDEKQIVSTINFNKIEIINKFKKKAIKKGSDILKNNKFFKDLDNVMDKKNNFRLFYDEYFKDFTDIKTMIFYMKLYETIELEYAERHGVNIEKELLAYMIKEIMRDDLSRKNVYESFHKFTNNSNPKNKKYVLDLFEYNNNVYKNKKCIKNF
jgi:hypothetical protein